MNPIRFYDDPVPTLWTAPTVPVSSHAVTEVVDGEQAIDAVNGNTIMNARGRLLLVVQNTSSTEGETATITPRVSGNLRDGSNTFTVVPKALAVAPGEIGIIGPFSALFEFVGQKLIFDWTLGGSLTAEEVLVTPVLLP